MNILPMRIFFSAVLFAVSSATLAAPPVEIWSTATATRPSDGWVLIYRFADRMTPEFKKPSQPDRVVVSWRFNGQKGLPTISEQKSMDTLEDAIDGLSPNLATLVSVSTGNNKRQWVYYTQSGHNFIDAVQKIQPRAVVPLEFETVSDPIWAMHDSFVRSIRR